VQFFLFVGHVKGKIHGHNPCTADCWKESTENAVFSDSPAEF